jgi:hypothetical protein
MSTLSPFSPSEPEEHGLRHIPEADLPWPDSVFMAFGMTEGISECEKHGLVWTEVLASAGTRWLARQASTIRPIGRSLEVPAQVAAKIGNDGMTSGIGNKTLSQAEKDAFTELRQGDGLLQKVRDWRAKFLEDGTQGPLPFVMPAWVTEVEVNPDHGLVNILALGRDHTSGEFAAHIEASHYIYTDPADAELWQKTYEIGQPTVFYEYVNEQNLSTDQAYDFAGVVRGAALELERVQLDLHGDVL